MRALIEDAAAVVDPATSSPRAERGDATAGVPVADRADAGLALALLADLRDCALHLQTRSFTQAAVSMLRRDLLRAIPSAVGYSLRLAVEPGLSDVELTALDEPLAPGRVRSCLTVDLPAGPGTTATATFYATTPAAFDQLGALLAEAAPDLERVVLTGPSEGPLVPAIRGLVDYTRVDHAFGVLLGRGYSPVEARAHLAALTRRHGSVEGAAAHLLAGFGE